MSVNYTFLLAIPARKWPILNHKFQKILRSKFLDICQMIAIFLNNILNIFFSSRKIPIFRKFEFC